MTDLGRPETGRFLLREEGEGEGTAAKPERILREFYPRAHFRVTLYPPHPSWECITLVGPSDPACGSHFSSAPRRARSLPVTEKILWRVALSPKFSLLSSPLLSSLAVSPGNKLLPSSPTLPTFQNTMPRNRTRIIVFCTSQYSILSS